jgi:hypothetical protein
VKRAALIVLLSLGFVAPAAAELSKDVERGFAQQKLPRTGPLERVAKDAPPAAKTVRLARTLPAVPKDK